MTPRDARDGGKQKQRCGEKVGDTTKEGAKDVGGAVEGAEKTGSAAERVPRRGEGSQEGWGDKEDGDQLVGRTTSQRISGIVQARGTSHGRASFDQSPGQA
jgi:hypothetical protein